MKISKFPPSVLVAFVAVGLVAPQQAEATSVTHFDAFANITSNSFSPTTGTSVMNEGTGVFFDLEGADVSFQPFTWTGSGSNVVLVGAPILQYWVASNNSLSAQFDFLRLTSVTQPSPTGFLIEGRGTVALTGSETLESVPATIMFSFDLQEGTPNLYQGTIRTELTPDGGSTTLGLLAIGLLSLIAVEGLRRKLATRQNRYA